MILAVENHKKEGVSAMLADTINKLDFLPADFTPDDVERIHELAQRAVRHVENDLESTVTPDILYQVARTLVDAACDARTVMVFFMSQLDEDETNLLRERYDVDLIESAHSVSIIRLLNKHDSPTQMPIRKVLLRQLVLKATHDVRVMMIKIAGRLVTLRNTTDWEEDHRQMLAREALEVVVPWCDALGLEEWRQEIQELSFKILNPEKYNFIIDLMRDHRDILHEVKDEVTREIKALLNRHDIEAQVTGRVKTYYAVFRKMEAYDVDYDEIWDRVGIRILTNSVFDCYYIQTAIEEELYPERRRYHDYIEAPRQPYNYQSIHLTVGGPKNTSVEIQIRTFDMHIKGEFGVAAHWKMYGGGEGVQTSEDTKFAFLRTQASRLLGDPMDYLGNTLETLLLNNSILPTDTAGYIIDPATGERARDSQGNLIFYRDCHTSEQGYIIDPQTQELILSAAGEPIWYQSEVLPDRVIVYTPNGDLKSLPKGATPLDFAYYVHENVGHTCIGARVNSKMQKLDYALQLGDRVEIITRKGSKPSLDWLYNGYSRTRRAHAKIKRYFREKTDVAAPEVEEIGNSIIKKRFSAHKIRDLDLDQLVEMLRAKSRSDLLEAIGSGDISVARLDEVLGNYLLEQLSQKPQQPSHQPSHVSHKEFTLLYHQAQCCLPVPGDETISYISQGKGFTLHRLECRNVGTLDPQRVADFDWPDFLLCEDGNKPPALFISQLSLMVVNPPKTILYIKEIASMENLPIESVRIHNNQQLGTQISIAFRAACKAQVDRLIRKLNTSDDILMIRRPLG